MQDTGAGADAPPADAVMRPLAGPIAMLAERIALIGGLISLSVAGLVVTSVLGRWLFAQPVTGDFDLVQMGTAVSVFAFLPLAQARRSNIMVDTFTSWLPYRVQAAIDVIWDIVYAGMAALLTYCLVNGTIGEWRTGTTAQMIALPTWPAVAACALMCAILAIVALATACARRRP
ncbi:MAG TPA: TRAP transporter small permease [Hyphomicrobiaceae bacterium]|nr:TRAP transporter small permease [Hyphomicrobiaceae bacterium]